MSPDRDDDIRELLARRAADVEPRGTFADVERKLAVAPAAPSWHRRALAGVAAVLALLVGAGVVAVATDRDGSQGVTADEPAGTTTTVTAPDTTAPPTPDTQAPLPPPETTPATDPAPTTTVAPTTTTTTPPTQPVTLASRITLYGIDALELPLTRAEVTELTGQELTPPSGDFVGSTCDYTRFVDGPADVSFMTDGDRVVRVDVVDGTAIRTVSGIGIGSSEAEVRATYPEAVVAPGKYAGLDVTVTDPDAPDHKLIIQVTDGVVTGYRSGLAEFVDYVEGCA